ncbi:MAG: DUF4492 domain-containing protein [Bacteroidaceae bacterium]|nr:DUF4492 domain-containing protein [Bacteroidaceae bacterium]
MSTKTNALLRVCRFYYEGFRSMTLGRTLWLIILLKLAIMFLVLRLFFFQPVLEGLSEQEKQEAVGRELLR